jgi:hypothetical protein
MQVKMVAKNEFLRSQFFYFLMIFIAIIIFNNIQAIFLSQIKIHWLHIDILSIIIAYLSIEKSVLFSSFFAIFTGYLLQTSTPAPYHFFVLYFLSTVTITNLVCNFIVLTSTASKNFLFCFLYLIKYILFYFIINNRNEIGLFTLLFIYWKEIFTTILAAFLVYPILLKIDSQFIFTDSLKKR